MKNGDLKDALKFVGLMIILMIMITLYLQDATGCAGITIKNSYSAEFECVEKGK